MAFGRATKLRKGALAFCTRAPFVILPAVSAKRVSVCYAIRWLASSRRTAGPRVVAARTGGWLVARQQARCVVHGVPVATALHGFATALLCWCVAPTVTHAHYFERAPRYCCVRPTRCVVRPRCAAHGSGSWCAGWCAMHPHCSVNALRCWTAPIDSSVCRSPPSRSLLNVQRYCGARSYSSWNDSLHFVLNFVRCCVMWFQWSRELCCGRFQCATQRSASR